jgi:hypothetical protein
VVGTLSATDSHPVSYALGLDPGHMFSIDGNKLLLDENMPANQPNSVGISIIATDTVTNTHATQNITVGINAAPAAISAATVGSQSAAPAFIAGSNESLTLGGGGVTAITLGSGSGEVWGGSGADAYYFPASGGLQTIEDWSAAKGDTLTIDSSLRGLLQETTTAAGTLLSFGDSSHGVLLAGVAGFDTSQLRWG